MRVIRCVLSMLFVTLSLTVSSQDRWKIGKGMEIDWNIDGRLPHSDFIEMSGLQISTVVRYNVDGNGVYSADLSVLWPMLRTVPNNTHATLNRHFNKDYVKMVCSGKNPLDRERLESVKLNGTLETKGVIDYRNGKLQVTRILFPSVDKPVFCTKYILKNIGDKEIKLEIPGARTEYVTAAADGVYGAYSLVDRVISKVANITLAPGKEYSFASVVSGVRVDEPTPEVDVDEELAKRKELVARLEGDLVLETPDKVLNTMFAFAKLRGSESIYATKGGLMHGPGGESYYAAIWANDQAEYINPFFPFLGYDKGNESALNSYRHFARFMNPENRPIPSSIIAEGVDIWNGAGDRGDAAMIAYGAARYALALGDKKKAEELWVLVEWCLNYCRSRLNADGVVESDSDELEGRFPAGDANLCTSCLYYDALNSAVCLGKALEKPVNEYAAQAKALKADIGKYFAAKVEGYDTYRYYDGNDKLRSWICMPLTVGIFDRRDATLDALFEKLWTKDGLLSQTGTSTFWDRSTLYAFRGAFFSGGTERAMEYLLPYSRTRLLGEHVPYAIEAWPEGNQRHLSAESGLYCRIFTEGLFGMRPTGLKSFEMTPRLPDGWDRMSLKNIRAFASRFDVSVVREGSHLRIKVTSFGKVLSNRKVKPGTTVSVNL